MNKFGAIQYQSVEKKKREMLNTGRLCIIKLKIYAVHLPVLAGPITTSLMPSFRGKKLEYLDECVYICIYDNNKL